MPRPGPVAAGPMGMRPMSAGPVRQLWLRWFPAWFLRAAGPDRVELGLAGEALAARHVKRGGARLLGRRVRTPCGEVDLVFATRTELACIEVKTGRVSSLFAELPAATRPARRFDQRRYQRQARAARLLAGSRSPGMRPRVDLVEVLVDRSSGRVRVLHHRRLNAGFAPQA